MRVLVTGGSGFLGRFVVRKLVDRRVEVAALVRRPEAAEAVEALGAESIRGDLDDAESTAAAFASSRADHLVNIASLGFGHATTIIDAARQAGIHRSLFVSTTAIFTALPAASKKVRVAAETSIRASGLGWIIVRPTMIYGAPGDRNMERLLRFVKRVPFVPTPGDGEHLQQPVHVDDLAEAIVTLSLGRQPTELEVNLPGPEPLTFKQVVEEAGRAVGRRARVVPIPYRLTVGALRGYERLSSHPRLKAEQVERLVEDKTFDVEPARRLLDYEPRSFANGIRDEARALGMV